MHLGANERPLGLMHERQPPLPLAGDSMMPTYSKSLGTWLALLATLTFGFGACSTEVAPLPIQSDAAAPVPESGSGTFIGPAGGELSAPGARIEIPPGALLEPTQLTLTTAPGRVGIEPDVDLLLPAKVFLSREFEPNPADVVYVHETGDGVFADLEEGDAESWFFAQFFSAYDRLPKTPRKGCDDFASGDVWPTHSAFDGGPPKVVGQRATGQPSKEDWLRENRLRWADAPTLNKGCLVDVRDTVTNGSVPWSKRFDRVDEIPAKRLAKNKRLHQRSPDEVFLMSQEVADRLEVATRLFHEQTNRRYEIWLNGGVDTSGSPTEVGVHELDSFHNYGAAVDLKVCELSGCDPCGENCQACEVNAGTGALHGVLAKVAVQAGFSWVWLEPNPKRPGSTHVHASVASPSCGVARKEVAAAYTCAPPPSCSALELACCRLDIDPAEPLVADPRQPGNPRKRGCVAVSGCANLSGVSGPSPCPTTTATDCRGYYPARWEAAYRAREACRAPGRPEPLDDQTCTCPGFVSKTGSCD